MLIGIHYRTIERAFYLMHGTLLYAVIDEATNICLKVVVRVLNKCNELFQLKIDVGTLHTMKSYLLVFMV